MNRPKDSKDPAYSVFRIRRPAWFRVPGMLLLLLLIIGAACAEGKADTFDTAALEDLGEMYSVNEETGVWICNGRITLPVHDGERELSVLLHVHGGLDGSYVSAPYLTVSCHEKTINYDKSIGVARFAVSMENDSYSWEREINASGDDQKIYLGESGISLIRNLAEAETVTIRYQPDNFRDPEETLVVDQSTLNTGIGPLCRALNGSDYLNFVNFENANEFERSKKMQHTNRQELIAEIMNADQSPAKPFAELEGFSVDPSTAMWTFQREYTGQSDGYEVRLTGVICGKKATVENCRIELSVNDETGNEVIPASLTMGIDGVKYSIRFKYDLCSFPPAKEGDQLFRAIADGTDLSIQIRLQDAARIKIESVDPESLKGLREFTERCSLSNIREYLSKDAKTELERSYYCCEFEIN